jgi:hypothetical protein
MIAAQTVIAPETPAQATGTPVTATPTAPSRSRPALASGAAAAIAAAVAAAKARQAEEEKQQAERELEEVSAPVVRASPLVVSALATTRLVPPPTASFKRPENGSGVFVTEDPLVVKRPAAVVMTQRMNAAEATAAVAPPPPPPTRLPGTKAIPVSTPRGGNGTAEMKTALPTPGQEKKAPTENLPMRRPPSEVYAKGKRRRSSALSSAERSKRSKPFPWAFVIFGLVLAAVAGALIIFSWSAPKYASAPTLRPEKMTFLWKPISAYPAEQLLTLKGGPANASYMATSDEDWLVVTPEGDEANNRTWQVKVEPDKLGTTAGPSTNTGWVDVTSAEGFKTQAEVTLKIGTAEATLPVKSNDGLIGPKANQTPVAGTNHPATPLFVPYDNRHPSRVGKDAAGTGNGDGNTAKTVTGKPAGPAKKPANDGTVN